MTRRKKEISFEADWKSGYTPCVYRIDINDPFQDFLVSDDCELGKRIIRALGRKEGKIRITLERVE